MNFGGYIQTLETFQQYFVIYVDGLIDSLACGNKSLASILNANTNNIYVEWNKLSGF